MANDKNKNSSNNDKNTKVNVHEGHRDRMRNRIDRNGIDSLEEHEVLEYLLFHVIPRKDCNPLAHALLNEFGCLYNVFTAEQSSLLKVPEMTKIAAQFLSLFFKIYDKAMLSRSGNKVFLKTTQEIITYAAHKISRELVECLLVILLDINNKVIRCKKYTDDNHKEVRISYNQIVLAIAETHADKVIIAHNHPSGGLKPSDEDIEFYNDLKKAIRLTNVTLIDSVIVSNESGISIKEYLSKKKLKIYVSDIRTPLSSLLDNLEDDDDNYIISPEFISQSNDDYLFELIKEQHENLLIEDEENNNLLIEDTEDSDNNA